MKRIKIGVLAPLIVAAFLSLSFLSSAFAKAPLCRSDEKITEEVQDKIKSNLNYTVFDWVTVATNNGVVTLDGYVYLPWSKKIFENIASEVEGVKYVNDNIEKVNGPDDLRYRAARAVYSNWLFEKYRYLKDPPVHIIVINNTVILKGGVVSEVEKDWASALIEWNTNAFKVENDLLVEKS
jgi:hypothetical protein